jgi:DNA-binding HxlR family transcriptional regulator
VIEERFEVPPRIEYEITDLGFGLLEPMQHLVNWIGGHWRSIKKARENFDASAAHEAAVRRIKRVAP